MPIKAHLPWLLPFQGAPGLGAGFQDPRSRGAPVHTALEPVISCCNKVFQQEQSGHHASHQGSERRGLALDSERTRSWHSRRRAHLGARPSRVAATAAFSPFLLKFCCHSSPGQCSHSRAFHWHRTGSQQVQALLCPWLGAHLCLGQDTASSSHPGGQGPGTLSLEVLRQLSQLSGNPHNCPMHRDHLRQVSPGLRETLL